MEKNICSIILTFLVQKDSKNCDSISYNKLSKLSDDGD